MGSDELCVLPAFSVLIRFLTLKFLKVLIHVNNT